MFYWDHAASTPPYEDVIRTIAEVMEQHYGNPSSMHQWGEDSSRLIKHAREVCSRALDVKPSEIIFTSGATEGNNLAIKGATLQYMNRGKHLITTQIEHASVYESFQQLQQWGFEVTFLPVDSQGCVDPASIREAIRKDTVLVSIMHVNNEIGAIQPIEAIGDMIKRCNPRTIFHVDGVQGFGKLPVDLTKWQVDLYTLSAHKFRGPKGIGLLYVREGLKLTPILTGGAQESGLRAGTENVPLIVALAKAMRKASEQQESFNSNVSTMRDQIHTTIQEIKGLKLHSHDGSAPHIVHFSYPGMKSEVLLHTLEEQGILVSTRSACSSKQSEPSRVLLSMGLSIEEASSGIRISMGDMHTEDELRLLQQALRISVEQLEPLQRGRMGK
ncbi:cysteine desulfurase family protein [Paenibacillus crassostreae]|uniref:Cysteine desulfurase n=1 Tax=Paenibacillus crassostreae TaxID=1763538 RepID=A0A167C328_9BACL|nr:cysteine desulfurase family protein [Paenibacillus crassostreae]AOZ91706.1 cysteine desulfurase NifS [Paenibacillus crassostreae]OAB72722.1 cysteine desulfurase [Paenibacillus crassostreae]